MDMAFRFLDPGYWLLDTRYWLLDSRRLIFDDILQHQGFCTLLPANSVSGRFSIDAFGLPHIRDDEMTSQKIRPVACT
ncbi:hypothetical protein D1BOALGB6SA_10738 [Olavius sp. associated proteobacterium Delta 1]|nr:hypothetical protein D1BOALGB6SA_10738 [Olavius sp. associated proteobacterium Delta 1]